MSAVGSDLGDGQLQVLRPSASWELNSRNACAIGVWVLLAQVRGADPMQESLNVVEDLYRGRRVIHGRRSCFDSDVGDNAQGEGGILLNRTFDPRGSQSAQLLRVG